MEKMITGEILSTDEALNALYDLADPNAYMAPAGCKDSFRVIYYDTEFDEFTDVFGGAIMRNGWVQDHDEWVLYVA